MISHKNLCVIISSSKTSMELYESDVYISYLPLAHVMERSLYSCMLYYGARVGVYSGNNHKLVEDMSCLEPTIFVSVPRIFNKMYDKIKKGI